MTLAEPVRQPDYGLGHSISELDRLKAQARILEPITRRFLHEAGLGPGMRVLDVGSGCGDVALLAAEIVGANGEVMGVDRSESALDIARSRAAALGRHNLSFRAGDAADLTFEQPFDAVIGRYVVQFQPEPGMMLKKLAAHLRPGGLLIFHETDWYAPHSVPAAPIYDKCCRWIVRTMELLGAEMHMGLKLYGAFVAAGLPEPQMRMEVIVGGGANAMDRLSMVVSLVQTLSDSILRFGVATPEEIEIEPLMDALGREVVANGKVITGHGEVAAWTTV